MLKFVTQNGVVDSKKVPAFYSDAVHDLRHAVLFPSFNKPNIQLALQRINFTFHRTCSYSDLVRECHVVDGETLVMFWGSLERDCSDTRCTMSASSSSSVHAQPSVQTSVRGSRVLRSTAQQTDFSCRRHSPVCVTPGSPVSLNSEYQRTVRARIADSLSSQLQPAPRSASFLGSVCTLLLNKGSPAGPKEVSGSISRHSDDICRICFGGESVQRLVRPCSCRGTVAAVHRSCLERWLLQAATSRCELCRHRYVVTRSHKRAWLGSLWAWARAGGGRALAADACRAAGLVACCALGTSRALTAAEAVLRAGARRGGGAALAANVFSSLLIGVVGALDGLLTTWLLLKIREHRESWRAWRDGSLRVRVTLAGEARTPTPRGSDAVVAPAAEGEERFVAAASYVLPDS